MFLKFSSLKSNSRLTRHSRSSKHGGLGHVIEQEKCHAVACEKYTFHLILNLVNHFLINYNPFYLVFNNMGHGRKFKQMRLCADFHARSIHVIWFLTTWVTVENSSKCVFVLISMLGRVKNSHYSSCYA